jgi:hypothetical protein
VLVLLAIGGLGEAALPRMLGYRLGRRTIVRCRQAHLFETIWIPGASLKALRLGPRRLQRCPVGGHWSLVSPVREANLPDAELAAAHAVRDIRLP